MNAVYLSLGSNLHPEKNIPEAIELLKNSFTVLAVSSVYETDPVGPAGVNQFWNLAAAIQSEEPGKLKTKIRAIETQLGRIRTDNKFAPRTIDIDILPQADYQTLAFIIIPLAEIAPNEKDPETGKRFSELAGALKTEAKKFRRIEL